MKNWEILDYLDEKGCFINGITGQPSHMEAYMTIISYNTLKTALEECSYSLEELKNLSKELNENAYLSPINKLTANEIDRFIKKRESHS